MGHCARYTTGDWVICISYESLEFNSVGGMIRRVADPASSYAGYVGMVDVNSEYSTLLHSMDDLYPVSGSW